MPDLKLIAKWGFAILVIVSLAALVERLTAAKYSRVPNEPNVQDLIMASTIFPTTKPIDFGLNEDFSKCLTEHSKLDYLSFTYKKRLINPIEETQTVMQNTSSVCPLTPGMCIYYFLIDFRNIMESLNVKLELIEPSVLFCLLPSSKRYNLLSRGFSPSKFRGSGNVMTFRISESDAKTLDKASTRKKIIYSGFKILRFPKSAEFKPKNDNEPAAFDTLHYVFKRGDLVTHLIVFYSRETYKWYSGLSADINTTGLLFLDDGAYDNYTTMPLNLDNNSEAQIYLPSDPRCFLLATDSSKFLECKKSLVSDATSSNSTSSIKEQLQNQAFIALKELKKIFGLYMVTFWLWSKTLHGWFEHCDILHYSSELELSIAVKSVANYNFTGIFAASEVCQTVKQDFNLSVDPNVELDCKGMPVKIAFMYEDKHVAWYAFQDKQSSYRQIFPVFQVCSVDVFGLRVNVPCDTAKIFETEFGLNWRNISLDFSPESMINLSTLN